MANRIKGITIEIGGDTTNLQNSLKDVDKNLKTTNANLKDVNNLLKFDPSNTELLRQKQELLKKAIEDSRTKLDTLNEASKNLDLNSDEYNAVQREIIAVKKSTSDYETELNALNDASDEASDGSEDLADSQKELGEETKEAGDKAKDANEGWTVAKGVLADLASNAIQSCVQGLKDLASGLKDVATESAGYADDVLTMSATTGLSTEQLQEFMYMEDLIDVSTETMAGAMKKLTMQMGNARDGSATASEAFEKLGVSVTDESGALRDNEDVFDDAIEALGQIENETERDALAMDLFGKSATELNPLIEADADALDQLREEAHDTGYVLDEETLGTLGALQDSFDRMGVQLTSTKNNLASEFAPALEEGVTQLTDFAGSIITVKEQFTNGDIDGAVDTLSTSILGLAGKIGESLPTILEVGGEIILMLMSGILQALPQLLSQATTVILKLASQLLSNLPQIISAGFQIILAVLNGLTEATPQLIEQIPIIISEVCSCVIDNLPLVLEAGISLLMALASGLIDAIPDLILQLPEIITSIITFLLDSTPQIISAGVQLLVSLVANLPAILISILGAIGEIVLNLTDYFEDVDLAEVGENLFNSLWDSLGDIITNAKEKAGEVVDKVKDALSTGWNNLKSVIKLPHFTVTGAFSLNPPSMPKLSVSWYAKAMQEGMILNSPTIFGMNGNTLLGGGEAGQEAVVGVSSLRDMIEQASGGNTINMVVNGAVGQDVHQLAKIVEQDLYIAMNSRKAVWA